eukprot:CAMPEP_0117449478 /NCGR_PEP_ID=MMETSP0759-20121206/7966_1 /TAXON_ID=63605 /ORGANISM="Percolomonas cosmopolitus, Strain WS" /LENGTH=720 /DNA_ID=CAMNT_0005241955 /DNA_START=160 /DNA_END=2325 /DNA_ORIENTATION=+
MTSQNQLARPMTPSLPPQKSSSPAKILSLAPDCFTNMFSFLSPQNLAVLSSLSNAFRELVFERVREIRAEKTAISKDFLVNFEQLNRLEVVNVKSGFDELTKNVIERQQFLKTLILERVDDRESNVLNLQEMHGLEHLEVHWAKFMHDVRLSPIAVEKHLRHLKLHNMAFSDFYFNQLPQHMGVAINLRELDLSFCQNVVEPSIVSFAPNLTHLNISRTGIMNQTIYHIIKNCHELRVLIADSNEHLGNGHLIVKNHPKLEILSLNLCRRLYDFSTFACPALQKIDISRTPVQNAHLSKLFRDNAHVPEILIAEDYKAFENSDFDLELKMSPSASPAPENGSMMQEKSFVPLKCRKINLACTFLESSILEQFFQAAAETIEDLDANNTQITNLSLPSFFSMPRLKRIDVSSTNITNQAVELILAMSPSLEEFTARVCIAINDELVMSSQSVRMLDLTGSPINTKSLREILKRCPQLEKLIICSAIEQIELESTSLKEFSCATCTTLSHFTLGACPKLHTLHAHSLVSLVSCVVTDEGRNTPLKLIELQQSPQLIGRQLSEVFPEAKIDGFTLKRDIMDIENPSLDELRSGFRKYQNLHSTHVLVNLSEKTQQMIDKSTGMEQDQLRDLKSKICLQIGHYRSIQGRNLEEGVANVQESLQFFEERIALGIPENYFRIKNAYEVLLALYGNMTDKEKEFTEVTLKLHEWVERNKLDEEKNAE